MRQPAVVRGGLEHGVFARHLIGKGRHLKRVLDAAHHIQVGHAGLDHHHVGTFGNVQRHLAQGLVAVAGVHLVDLLVALAKVAGRTHGVAKRAVKGRGVLGAVGHDAGMDVALRFQRRPDGADAPVHHVAGRHDVDTGGGLRQCLLHQHRHRGVVQDVAAVIGQAVLAVAGVGVQRHVGHHAEFGKLLFQRPHHARHQAVGVGRFLAVVALERLIDHRKQGQHRDLQAHTFLGHRQQQVQAEALHARHGGDGHALLHAVDHEHRVDQVVAAERVFTHQVAGKGIAAQAPGTAKGIRSVGCHKGKIVHPSRQAAASE